MRRRILGSIQGEKGGPLLVCLAGMHGNEPAGVKAFDYVFKIIIEAQKKDPSFRFKGGLLGTLGNKYAFDGGIRFLQKDLNRNLQPDHITSILSSPKSELKNEDLEAYKLIRTFQKEIDQYNPTELFVLDLHTTTAKGGIFSIVSSRNEMGINIASQLGVPLILGFDNRLHGTTLDLFNGDFYGLKSTAIVFEAGQHNAPNAVKNSIKVLIKYLEALQIIPKDYLPIDIRELQSPFSRQLPRKTELVYVHKFDTSDRFKMKAGYQNFQPIYKGEHLADDINGPILSPYDGLMLMPLYQTQGEDGFFIIREID